MARMPFLLVLLLLALAPAVHAKTIAGDWSTPGGMARVHIAECGPALCGVIVWVKEPREQAGRSRTDVNNPDPTMRGRPVVGLQILRGLTATGEGQWGGGRIYNPDDGRTYDSKLTLRPDGALRVDGCVAFICLAQTWARAD